MVEVLTRQVLKIKVSIRASAYVMEKAKSLWHKRTGKWVEAENHVESPLPHCIERELFKEKLHTCSRKHSKMQQCMQLEHYWRYSSKGKMAFRQFNGMNVSIVFAVARGTTGRRQESSWWLIFLPGFGFMLHAELIVKMWWVITKFSGSCRLNPWSPILRCLLSPCHS